MLRVLRAFFSAVILAYVVAVFNGTQGVLNNIAAMGMPVSMADRMGAVLHDLIGMAASYLPLITLALLIAFLATGLLIRWFGWPRSPLYALGGFVAIIALHLIMDAALGLVGIAAARTLTGLLLQALAGALGGWLFAALSTKNPAASSTL